MRRCAPDARRGSGSGGGSRTSGAAGRGSANIGTWRSGLQLVPENGPRPDAATVTGGTVGAGSVSSTYGSGAVSGADVEVDDGGAESGLYRRTERRPGGRSYHPM